MNYTPNQYAEKLKDILKKATGFNYSVSVSSTDFGLSLYVYHNSKKIRFSDHSVTSVSRMQSEHLFDIKEITEYADQLVNDLSKILSDDYYRPIITTALGEQHRIGDDIHKDLHKNYSTVLVKTTEVVERNTKNMDSDKIVKVLSQINQKKYKVLMNKNTYCYSLKNSITGKLTGNIKAMEEDYNRFKGEIIFKNI